MHFNKHFLLAYLLLIFSLWFPVGSVAAPVYDVLEEDSDYADAVTSGVKQKAQLVFSTCDCSLPSIPTDTDNPVIQCRTKIGYHEVYIEGSRESRKTLAKQGSKYINGVYIKPKELIISGKIIDLMVQYSVDRVTGKKTDGKKSPIIKLIEIKETGATCY